MPSKQSWLIFVVALALAAFMGVSRAAEKTSNLYAVGQVWKYHTRKGEEASVLQIARIDVDPKFGRIYHLRIEGLNVRNHRTKGGKQHDLPHIPVSRKTLDDSVTQLVRTTRELPDISPGYGYWREAFDAGKAGVFTLNVADIITGIEQGLAAGNFETK